MAVKVNGDAGKMTLERGAQRLLRTAVFFVDQYKRRVNVSNPRPYTTPSKPGEYPRVRTGHGRDSVTFGPTDVQGIIDADMKIRIGVMPIGKDSNYMLILELRKNRLGFKHTMEDLREQLRAKLMGKV
jgi:hypothetical protein